MYSVECSTLAITDSAVAAVASSVAVGSASCASSTYIRSQVPHPRTALQGSGLIRQFQYNLNPPPRSSPHSPDPLPGYCPGPPGSEGPPSTAGDVSQWANTTTSSLDGGSVLGNLHRQSDVSHKSCCSPYPTVMSSTGSTNCCHSAGPGLPHPGHCPAYLSSALSTSSADSGSVSGSGSRTCSGSGGSGSAGGGTRRPQHFKSFSGALPPGLSQVRLLEVELIPVKKNISLFCLTLCKRKKL